MALSENVPGKSLPTIEEWTKENPRRGPWLLKDGLKIIVYVHGFPEPATVVYVDPEKGRCAIRLAENAKFFNLSIDTLNAWNSSRLELPPENGFLKIVQENLRTNIAKMGKILGFTH